MMGSKSSALLAKRRWKAVRSATIWARIVKCVRRATSDRSVKVALFARTVACITRSAIRATKRTVDRASKATLSPFTMAVRAKLTSGLSLERVNFYSENGLSHSF